MRQKVGPFQVDDYCGECGHFVPRNTKPEPSQNALINLVTFNADIASVLDFYLDHCHGLDYQEAKAQAQRVNACLAQIEAGRKELSEFREKVDELEASLGDEETGGLETFDLWKFQEKRADMLYEQGNAMHEKGKAFREEVIKATLSGREIDTEISIDFGITLAGWPPVLSETTEPADEGNEDPS